MSQRIVIKQDQWDYWHALVQHTKGEVACFGYCTLDPEHEEVYVDTLFIVPQEADATQVDFVTNGMPYAIEKAVADDRLDDLHFCVHSHGEMSTFWSTTDDDMIEKMGLTAGWFVSMVSNRKGENRGRIDLYNVEPLGCQLTLNDVPCVPERSLVMAEQAAEDFKAFVKKPAPPVRSFHSTTKGKGVTTTSPLADKPAPMKGDKTFDELTRDELKALGLTPWIYDGVRHWMDETGDVVHEEPLDWGNFQDETFGFSTWAWDDDVVDSTATNEELSPEEFAFLMAANAS